MNVPARTLPTVELDHHDTTTAAADFKARHERIRTTPHTSNVTAGLLLLGAPAPRRPALDDDAISAESSVACPEKDNVGRVHAVDGVEPTEADDEDLGTDREMLDLETPRKGQVFRRLSAETNPSNAAELKSLLADAIRRSGLSADQICAFEMNVRYRADRGLITTFVAMAV